MNDVRAFWHNHKLNGADVINRRSHNSLKFKTHKSTSYFRFANGETREKKRERTARAHICISITLHSLKTSVLNNNKSLNTCGSFLLKAAQKISDNKSVSSRKWPIKYKWIWGCEWVSECKYIAYGRSLKNVHYGYVLYPSMRMVSKSEWYSQSRN